MELLVVLAPIVFSALWTLISANDFALPRLILGAL